VCVGAKGLRKEVCNIKAQVVIFTFHQYDTVICPFPIKLVPLYCITLDHIHRLTVE
jgi:hypothetical protein